jgi:DNA-directed RNA polymerase subunit RPC12/RpoP
MSDRVSFRCQACHARLKAAGQLAGRAGHCPRCGETVVVPRPEPDEVGPLLVLDDEPRAPSRPRHSWS